MHRISLALLLAAGLLPAEESDLPGILDRIRKGSPSECVEALGKLEPGKEDRAANPIAIRLRDEADAQTRAALQEALVAFKSAPRVRAIKAALESKSVADDYRTLVCDMLADCKDEPAVTVVAKIAFESDMKAVREHGQKALVAYGDAAIKPTAPYIRGTNQRVADDAVTVLRTVDTEAAAYPLVACLVLGSEKELLRIAGVTNMTREKAVESLIAMGDEAVPALLGGLDSLNHQKWSSYCLQKISGEFFTQKDKAGWTGWWKRRLAEKAGK